MMEAASDEAIRERAYFIWVREGRQHGRELEHWLQAESELTRLAGTRRRTQRGGATTARPRSTTVAARRARSTPMEQRPTI
jgi:Protein of unknown function (DUF2934)